MTADVTSATAGYVPWRGVIGSTGSGSRHCRTALR